MEEEEMNDERTSLSGEADPTKYQVGNSNDEPEVSRMEVELRKKPLELTCQYTRMVTDCQELFWRQAPGMPPRRRNVIRI